MVTLVLVPKLVSVCGGYAEQISKLFLSWCWSVWESKSCYRLTKMPTGWIQIFWVSMFFSRQICNGKFGVCSLFSLFIFCFQICWEQTPGERTGCIFQKDYWNGKSLTEVICHSSQVHASLSCPFHGFADGAEIPKSVCCQNSLLIHSASKNVTFVKSKL